MITAVPHYLGIMNHMDWPLNYQCANRYGTITILNVYQHVIQEKACGISATKLRSQRIYTSEKYSWYSCKSEIGWALEAQKQSSESVCAQFLEHQKNNTELFFFSFLGMAHLCKFRITLTDTKKRRTVINNKMVNTCKSKTKS